VAEVLELRIVDDVLFVAEFTAEWNRL